MQQSSEKGWNFGILYVKSRKNLEKSVHLDEFLTTFISKRALRGDFYIGKNRYYVFPNNRACSINFFAFLPRMFDLIRNSRLLIFEDQPTIKSNKKTKKKLIKVGDEFRPKSPLWPGSSTYLMTLFVVVVAIFLKKSSSADANDATNWLIQNSPRMFNY